MIDGTDLPMGFSMALANNQNAMTAFANMTDAEQQAVVSHTKSIRSKKEMQLFINSIGENKFLG